MTNVTEQIAESTWAILTYEEAWKSYINSYVIAKDDAFVLVDSHLRKHRPYFQQALVEIGVKPEQIAYVYFTHRHADHIGNADLFPSRHNWIHLEDYYELDDFSQTFSVIRSRGLEETCRVFDFGSFPSIRRDLSPSLIRIRKFALSGITSTSAVRHGNNLSTTARCSVTLAGNSSSDARTRNRKRPQALRKDWKFCWTGRLSIWLQGMARSCAATLPLFSGIDRDCSGITKWHGNKEEPRNGKRWYGSSFSMTPITSYPAWVEAFVHSSRRFSSSARFRQSERPDFVMS